VRPGQKSVNINIEIFKLEIQPLCGSVLTLLIIARLVWHKERGGTSALKRSAEGRSDGDVDKNVCGIAVFCFR
jgi:hypothetical protein